MSPTAVVILAAGAGSRFDGARHKLLAELDGRPLIAHAVAAALDAAVGPVLVVWGAVDLGPALDGFGVDLVRNERWAEGQATSLQVGIAAADRPGVEAVVVGLGAQPFVPGSAWQLVAATGGPVATASFGGRPRPPVRLERSVWPLLPTRGDEGARSLVADRPDLVIRVEVSGEPADIDTLDDLQRWS